MRGRNTFRALTGWFLTSAAALAIGIAAAQAPGEDPPHDASAYETSAGDISASIRITQSDMKELSKIGADFSMNYSIRNMSLQYKQPDKIRLEGKSPTRGTALLIQNGPTLFVDVPRFKIHKAENLEKSPSRRQSLLELAGVITPDTLKFMMGTFVKSETLDGRETAVFDLKYVGVEHGQSYRVWLDDKTHTTLKREWYDGERRLKATFLYSDPKEVSPGVWLPTRGEIKNADGVVAAVLTMEDIKVNQGLRDGLFAIPS